MSFSLTWDNPFIWFMVSEYVGIILGVFYWVYNTRLRMGFKAEFFVKGTGERDSDVVVESGGKVVDVIKGIYSYVFDKLGNVVDIIPNNPSTRDVQYKWIGEKEFKATDKVVSFKGKSIPIDLSKLSRRKFGFEYLAIDFDAETIITFGGVYVTGGDAQIVDDVMAGGLFSGLFKLGDKLNKMQVMMLLFAIIVGAMTTALITVAIYQGYIIPNMLEGWVPRESTSVLPSFPFIGGVLNGLV